MPPLALKTPGPPRLCRPLWGPLSPWGPPPRARPALPRIQPIIASGDMSDVRRNQSASGAYPLPSRSVPPGRSPGSGRRSEPPRRAARRTRPCSGSRPGPCPVPRPLGPPGTAGPQAPAWPTRAGSSSRWAPPSWRGRAAMAAGRGQRGAAARRPCWVWAGARAGRTCGTGGHQGTPRDIRDEGQRDPRGQEALGQDPIALVAVAVL